MKTTIISADSRGHADHGWLNARHSFSFASYYDPARVHFGALRVLNDDIVAPAMGFSKHPHDNMEIISIPLAGTIRHKDSMGNTSDIKAGEIQVMSAGTGIEHSEFNPDHHEALNLLQIWLFPQERNVEPRYQQMELPLASTNEWNQILSPDPDDAGVWIHQQAWFFMGEFEAGKSVSYVPQNAANGLYIFVIDGAAVVEGNKLDRRDALTIEELSSGEAAHFEFSEKSRVLVMEVPMNM